MNELSVSAAIAAALAAGKPVVALESTLITHGFAAPLNLDAARRAEAAVRAGGAEPATVAVHDGRLLIGLTDAQLEDIAAAQKPRKASRGTLALALAEGGWAGTTVSATMIAAHLAGIRVFATGGIGGVHRGGAATWDVSADLDELARTPVLVVCAGPKSMLDIDLTLEYLETRGVPVLGWGTTQLAGFYAQSSGRTLAGSVANAAATAHVAQTHWSLGLGSGLIICAQLPEAAALDNVVAEAAIAQATADAAAAGVHGPATTPFVLARVAALTEGRSVTANLALIENNASIAAQIALELASA
ncbi:MAG: pseudouridine-5'-phosphate glycosidase [Chloroflexota bacterium]